MASSNQSVLFYLTSIVNMPRLFWVSVNNGCQEIILRKQAFCEER